MGSQINKEFSDGYKMTKYDTSISQKVQLPNLRVKWTCGSCTFVNTNSDIICTMCHIGYRPQTQNIGKKAIRVEQLLKMHNKSVKLKHGCNAARKFMLSN